LRKRNIVNALSRAVGSIVDETHYASENRQTSRD